MRSGGLRCATVWTQCRASTPRMRSRCDGGSTCKCGRSFRSRCSRRRWRRSKRRGRRQSERERSSKASRLTRPSSGNRGSCRRRRRRKCEPSFRRRRSCSRRRGSTGLSRADRGNVQRVQHPPLVQAAAPQKTPPHGASMHVQRPHRHRLAGLLHVGEHAEVGVLDGEREAAQRTARHLLELRAQPPPPRVGHAHRGAVGEAHEGAARQHRLGRALDKERVAPRRQVAAQHRHRLARARKLERRELAPLGRAQVGVVARRGRRARRRRRVGEAELLDEHLSKRERDRARSGEISRRVASARR